MALPPRTRLGPFEIGAAIGAGGMDQVSSDPGQPIAIFTAFLLAAVTLLLPVVHARQEAGSLQLVWVDRTGQQVEQSGRPGDYRGLDLSPDGTRVAIHRHDEPGGDIWILERDRTTRLTADPTQHNTSPVWSPDGRRVVFASKRNGRWGLYAKLASGEGGEDLLLESEARKMPMAWAPDGKSVVYSVSDGDVWMLSLAADRKTQPILHTSFNEGHPQVSPDGKWIAYGSTETGRSEIYVTAFPAGGKAWQASTGGGSFPRWRRDGRELYFLSAASIGKVMAASVDLSGPTAISVSPRALFDSGYVNLSHPDGNYFPYAVSADGQRFLIPRLVAPAAPATRVPADRKPYPDFALQAPVVNTAPGPEYAAWTRMFQNTPAIERTARGRLWAALVGGGANWGPLNYVVIVTSDDGGKSWSGPRLVVDPVDHVNATGPRLWRDPLQRLWLFWQQTYGRVDGRAGVWAIVSGNPDDASPAWSRPRRLADGNITGKPAVLSTGDWLAPVGVSVSPCDVPGINDEYRLGLTPSVIASLCHDLGDRKGTSVHRSTDQGQTWTWLGQARIPDVCCEHMVVERRDGSLWMLARTSYGIGQAISLDRGQSWVQTGESGIRHPVTKFFIERLKSGRLLLVRHNPPGALVRSHLTAYLSNDDGKSWTGALLLDERDNVSYPDGTEADDGTIHIIYDRGRTTDREILLATFKEEDVMRGTCVTTSCQLRRLVSKGGE